MAKTNHGSLIGGLCSGLYMLKPNLTTSAAVSNTMQITTVAATEAENSQFNRLDLLVRS